MIYTIIPMEQIMTAPEQEAPEASAILEKHGIPAKYFGEDVLLSQSKSGEYKIERLISTSPQCFLKAEFFPDAAVDIKNITLD